MSRFSRISRLSKLLTPALLIATAGAAQATNYYVGSLGSDAYGYGVSPASPCATIQFAIDQSSSGDTVYVLADTYSGTGNKNLDFGGRNITLEALPYYGTATMVTIDCQGSGRGFHFNNSETSAATVDKFSVINGNVGEDNGGGALIEYCSPTFIDCSFTSNKAYDGGAVYIYAANPAFTGMTFSKNSASVDGGAVYQDFNSFPTYQHSKFTSNKATGSGGAVYVYDGSATFSNDTFTGNTAHDGGAFYNYYYASPTFYGGTFSGNKASGSGGAFYNNNNCSSELFNTLITSNSAQYGGAFYNYYGSSPLLFQATVTGNTATFNGGACYNVYYSSPMFRGSILWNNRLGQSDNEIVDTDTTSATSLYICDIYGGWSGTGNLNTDPKFVSTTDFHLKSISPLIDAGAYFGYTVDDHDGNPRLCNGYIDLGAYELALPTAVSDIYSTYTFQTLNVSKANGVLANDLANKGGTLSAVLVSNPASGTLTFKSDGSFSYRPNLVSKASQSFTYKAKNSKGYSSVTTVYIHIN